MKLIISQINYQDNGDSTNTVTYLATTLDEDYNADDLGEITVTTSEDDNYSPEYSNWETRMLLYALGSSEEDITLEYLEDDPVTYTKSEIVKMNNKI